MAEIVIRVEGLSKQYRLGAIGGRTLRDDFARWLARLRGRPNPLLKIGQEDRARREGERIWALRDVSFEVRQGEVLGIIGRNGAGKSTLLKILSRITAPTTGVVKVRGRIASLLEVGTGFHPELTGRENIYLNGAILGMRRAEIHRRLDEIVAFAEVEQFLDTPVKRYSSGMYVRLAFAVAAHLESEILLVDEVLAVGDAAFQKKCLGKMGEVASGGRTVLFVSHSMGAISTLTRRCLLVRLGAIEVQGDTTKVVATYLASSYRSQPGWQAVSESDKPMQVMKVRLLNHEGRPVPNALLTTRGFSIEVEYLVRKSVRSAVVAANIHAVDGTHLASLEDADCGLDHPLQREPGHYRTTVSVPGNWLNSGTYLLRIGCGIPRQTVFDNIEVLSFALEDTGSPTMRGHRSGYLLPMLPWHTERIEQLSHRV